jgi:hypothetical protein
MAELLVAMILAAAITVAISHVTVQITSAATRVDKRFQIQTEAAVALIRMRTELEQATSIVALTSSKVTFQHPDVTGDSIADTVTYEWSGTAGDPVTRKVNAESAEDVLTQCRAFTLSTLASTIRLIQDTRYPIKLEYYEKTGSASCRLMWSASGISKQVIPQSRLFPAFVEVGAAAPTSTGTGLTGQYYDNSDLTALVLTRTDSTVDFNFGTGSPASTIGSDTFSVRWTGHLKPATTADYTFYVSSDDGVRLWVNDCLIIDNWTDHTATEYAGTTTGVTRIDVSLEAGPEGNTARLDGSVSLINLPGKGS